MELNLFVYTRPRPNALACLLGFRSFCLFIVLINLYIFCVCLSAFLSFCVSVFLSFGLNSITSPFFFSLTRFSIEAFAKAEKELAGPICSFYIQSSYRSYHSYRSCHSFHLYQSNQRGLLSSFHSLITKLIDAIVQSFNRSIIHSFFNTFNRSVIH